MFGSSILEVAIGVIFIYLLLSLVCTAVNEFISSVINKRGKNLFEGIRNLLNDPNFTGLAQSVYNHGLIDGISHSAMDPKKPNRRPSYIASKTFALALLDILGSCNAADSCQELHDRRQAEYDEAKKNLDKNVNNPEFQQLFDKADAALKTADDLLKKAEKVRQAYLELDGAAKNVKNQKDSENLKIWKSKFENALTLGRELAAAFPDQLENVQKGVANLPEGHTKQSLLVLINKAKHDAALAGTKINVVEDEMQVLQENIEGWFNDAMDRVGGWYKRWTQRILLGVSIVLVLFGNVDTFMLVKRFSRDNALRASIVTVATREVQNNTPNTTELLDEAGKLSLPLGWISNKNDPYKGDQVPICDQFGWSCVGAWLLKLIGLLISALAIQLGAPFWFDTLSKFVNIRSAGTPPGQSAKSGPQLARS
jgi:hypothetical protein